MYSQTTGHPQPQAPHFGVCVQVPLWYPNPYLAGFPMVQPHYIYGNYPGEPFCTTMTVAGCHPIPDSNLTVQPTPVASAVSKAAVPRHPAVYATDSSRVVVQHTDSKEPSPVSNSLVSHKSAFVRKRGVPGSVLCGPKRVKTSTADTPTGSWGVPFVSYSVDRSSAASTPGPQSWVLTPTPPPLMAALDTGRVAGNGVQSAVKRELPSTLPSQTPIDLSKYEDTNSSFKCRDCGKGFKHRYNLTKHEEWMHNGDVFAGSLSDTLSPCYALHNHTCADNTMQASSATGASIVTSDSCGRLAYHK